MNRRDFLIGSSAAIRATVAADGISSAAGGPDSTAEAAGKAPIYEIYALKYAGPMPGKLALLLWMEGWDTDVDRNYYIWAIKGRNEIVVVDAGCRPSLAGERNLKNFVNPVDLLASIGADKRNLKKVILTHLHWDHLSGIEVLSEAFPEAVFYVQETEFDFWTNNPMARRAPFAKVSDERSLKALAQLEETPRLKKLSGDTKIMPGIEVLMAPGHTVGLQVVAVNTAKGTAIVASDCAHIQESFVKDIPSTFITNMIAWMESFDKLRAKASSTDLIFPGHDLIMHDNYPEVAENATRLV